MTTDRRRAVLLAVGIVMIVWLLASLIANPPGEETAGDQSSPVPTVTKTVTRTKVVVKTKEVPLKCPSVVRRSAEYEKAISRQADAAGKLDMAGDDMLYALNTHDLNRIADTTTKYHRVYSAYVGATRDALSTADALGVAVAGCS